MTKTISIKWDVRWLKQAKGFASWSYDPSTQCGCIIVRPDNTLATSGYNGFPRGIYDDPELYNNREEKLKRILHSEMNRIHFKRESLVGCTLYNYPFQPCHLCAPHVIQNGIIRCVAPKPCEDILSRWSESIEFSTKLFNEANIPLTLYDMDFLEKEFKTYG